MIRQSTPELVLLLTSELVCVLLGAAVCPMGRVSERFQESTQCVGEGVGCGLQQHNILAQGTLFLMSHDTGMKLAISASCSGL